MAAFIDYLFEITQLKKILGHSSNTTTNMSDEMLLKKLKILSKIPQGGKLCVHPDSTITIEKESGLQGVKRLLSGDNRTKTVDIIKKIIQDSCRVAQGYIDHKYMDIYLFKEKPGETAVQEHNKLVHSLELLKNELKNCKTGINTLKESTYHGDADVEAELEIILEEIDSKIEDIEQKIKRVHYRYVLKEVSDSESMNNDTRYETDSMVTNKDQD